MGLQQPKSHGLPQTESASSQKSMRQATRNGQIDNDGTLKTSQGSSACIKFLINLLIYAICILSLSISVYLSYQHQKLENNVKSLMYLDNRVARLEFEFEEIIRSQQRDNSEDGRVVVDDGKGAMVTRYYSEITRLKRDVSTLKESSRRHLRQSGSSPNECMCPPGEWLISAFVRKRCCVWSIEKKKNSPSIIDLFGCAGSRAGWKSSNKFLPYSVILCL